MESNIYWITSFPDKRLAILPRPRGGEWLDDEINCWQRAGVDVVVSLLQPHEEQELGLLEEERLCRQLRLEFSRFPMLDRGLPESRAEFSVLIEGLWRLLQTGKSIGVHCRLGVGRSSMIAAALLVRAGETVQEAFACIAQSRGMRVPDTAEQAEWIERWASTVKTTTS